MLIVIGRFTVAQERRDAFLQFAQRLVQEERQESGCLGFDVTEDVTRPGSYLMIERWHDERALEQHMGTPRFEANDAVLNTFSAGEVDWMTFSGDQVD